MNGKMRKYKNIIAGMFAAAVISTAVSGCTFGGNDSGASSENSLVSGGTSLPSAVENAQGDKDGEMSGDTESGRQTNTAQELKEAIAKAYGDNYLPDMEITSEMLESEFGLTEDMYEEIVAEMPTVGFHPDRLIIVKPAEGKEDEVEKALKNAKTRLVEQSTQYPVNIAKVNAAKVLSEDGYYCFMLLGEPASGDETEEEAAQFAEKQVEIGVTAFENFFEKF